MGLLLGQGIIILQFEVHFDIYGVTLVNHDKLVMVLELRVQKREFLSKQHPKEFIRMFGVANSGFGFIKFIKIFTSNLLYIKLLFNKKYFNTELFEMYRKTACLLSVFF